MPNCRRADEPGAVYFFTVALADRRSRVLMEHIDALRAAFAATVGEHPVRVDAMVLPDHLKARFTRAVGGEHRRSPSEAAKGERGLWLGRCWEHMIRDWTRGGRHVAYCWIDPVKDGLFMSRVPRLAALVVPSRRTALGLIPAGLGGRRSGKGEFGE